MKEEGDEGYIFDKPTDKKRENLIWGLWKAFYYEHIKSLVLQLPGIEFEDDETSFLITNDFSPISYMNDTGGINFGIGWLNPELIPLTNKVVNWLEQQVKERRVKQQGGE